AGHAAPNTLFPVGHKTQDQFVSNQSAHQSLGILEIMLAPSRRTIGKRLRPGANAYAAPVPATPTASTGQSIPSPLLLPPDPVTRSVVGATGSAWWRTAAVSVSPPAHSH